MKDVQKIWNTKPRIKNIHNVTYDFNSDSNSDTYKPMYDYSKYGSSIEMLMSS